MDGGEEGADSKSFGIVKERVYCTHNGTVKRGHKVSLASTRENFLPFFVYADYADVIVFQLVTRRTKKATTVGLFIFLF